MGDFWRHLYKLVRIEQRLSTAFYPQTNKGLEQINQEIQVYLQAFITYAQYNWIDLLPTAMLAINNRDTSLGASPFFLTHQYNIKPI